MHAHIEHFAENLRAANGVQGKGFHQTVKDIEKRYQDMWNRNRVADYCLMLRRDFGDVSYSSEQKATKRISDFIIDDFLIEFVRI